MRFHHPEEIIHPDVPERPVEQPARVIDRDGSDHDRALCNQPAAELARLAVAAQVHDGVGLEVDREPGLLQLQFDIAAVVGHADVHIDLRSQPRTDRGGGQGVMVPVGGDDGGPLGDSPAQPHRIQAFTAGGRLDLRGDDAAAR